MVVFDKFFNCSLDKKILTEFSQYKKKILTDNHYKEIYRPIKIFVKFRQGYDVETNFVSDTASEITVGDDLSVITLGYQVCNVNF